MEHVSRGRFVAGGLAGGVALAAAGPAGAARRAARRTQAVGDMTIVKVAAAAELMAIEFLQRALAADTELPAFRLREALQDERAHYKTLAGALGSAAPQPGSLTFTLPRNGFDDAMRISRLGFVFEKTFVAGYTGAVKALANDDYKVLAAQIAPVEAQHMSVFSEVLSRDPLPLPHFAPMMTPTQLVKALTPYIGNLGAQLTG